jgi:hypothetical protein
VLKFNLRFHDSSQKGLSSKHQKKIKMLYSPILSKNFPALMVGLSLAPKTPILAPFCGMNHQKSNFLLISGSFLSEAVEASRCYFFEI